MVTQGWSFAFTTHNTYRAMREALTMSYKYSYGIDVPPYFNPDHNVDGDGSDNDYSGSRSRAPATVIIVEDRLGLGNPGRYGSLNRVPYMMQRSAFHTSNMFMPLDDNEDYNLPRLDVLVNGHHLAFTTANFRDVDLDNWSSPYWNRYCLFPQHLQVATLNPPGADPRPFPPILGPPPYFDTKGIMLIDSQGHYVGPTQDKAGKGLPTPLYGFILVDWDIDSYTYYARFLPPEEYPDAPWVGCMELFTREYNNSKAVRWCDGSIAKDCGGHCCYDCPEERFDLDLNSIADHVDENGPAFDKVTGPTGAGLMCTASPDVNADMWKFFSWQWYPVAAVQDPHEDENDGSYQSNEMSGLRIGRPLKRHDFVDFPIGGGPGEKPVAGDRDLEEEQVIKFLDVDRYFGVVKKVRVLDMQGGDLNFSGNDDEEVGFFYGKGDPDNDGNITTQSPVNMYSQVKPGTYMSITEDGTSVVSVRQKNKVDLVERTIKLSNDTGRFTGGTKSEYNSPDGEPNPVQVVSNDCTGANALKTCYDKDDNMIYVRTIIKDTRGKKWTATK